VEVFETLGVPYFVTGSVATTYYGEPRLTNDIDVVCALQMRDVTGFCRGFPAHEFYLSEDAVRDAVAGRQQFNVIHPVSGLKVDVMVPEESPFNRSRFDRAKRVRVAPEVDARLATREDVILKKLEFFRDGGSEKHVRDIVGVLKVSGELVDSEYIRQWAQRLGLEELWHEVRNRVGT